jgi:hypothetical protein
MEILTKNVSNLSCLMEKQSKTRIKFFYFFLIKKIGIKNYVCAGLICKVYFNLMTTFLPGRRGAVGFVGSSSSFRAFHVVIDSSDPIIVSTISCTLIFQSAIFVL